MKFLILDNPYSNTTSVKYWINRNGYEAYIYSKDKLSDFDILIIPGVGSFDSVLKYYKKNKLIQFINKSIKKNKLVIGICLGMQIMFSNSDEGKNKGVLYFKTK